MSWKTFFLILLRSFNPCRRKKIYYDFSFKRLVALRSCFFIPISFILGLFLGSFILFLFLNFFKLSFSYNEVMSLVKLIPIVGVIFSIVTLLTVRGTYLTSFDHRLAQSQLLLIIIAVNLAST